MFYYVLVLVIFLLADDYFSRLLVNHVNSFLASLKLKTQQTSIEVGEQALSRLITLTWKPCEQTQHKQVVSFWTD
jgi:hypothetical protein